MLLKEPLYKLQRYQSFVCEVRSSKAMQRMRERQETEWNTFIDKPVAFKVPGYTARLTSDQRDIAITAQPDFTVKVSDGKHSANVRFSAATLDLWRRKVTEEVHMFKAAYGTEPDQLVVDPEGITVTLVRDAADTLRPSKSIDQNGVVGVELGLQTGEVLAPITVPLQLLAKKENLGLH